MPKGPAALFEAIRDVCPKATWSRGVDLSRADAVVGADAAQDQVVFRVSTRGGLHCPTVTLYVEDGEWDCDCRSREVVCEHVAAAVIAWRRSLEQGEALPAQRGEVGRVGYRFTRVAGGLALERVIAGELGELPLTATLAALSERRVAGPRFAATRLDLDAELVLGTHRRGLLPAPLVARVLRALAGCETVRLDGAPVTVAAEPLRPVVRVRERGEGFVLQLAPDSRVTERFANGIVLAGGTLAVPQAAELTARERERLEEGWWFGPEDLAELVTSVLPTLARRLAVEIETERLPRTVAERPRLVLDLRRTGDTLSVLPTLVYGDPPLARIDGGRFVHLRGPVPVRDPAAERVELRRLSQLGLAPGLRSELGAVEATALVARLDAFAGEIRGDGRDAFRLARALEPELRLSSDSIDVLFHAELELPGAAGSRGRLARRADAEVVLSAWRRGETLVPLLGGGFAPLPAEWLARYGARVADLLAAREPSGALPRAVLPDLAALAEALEQPAPAELSGLRALTAGFDELPAVALPEDLDATLRPYQRRGVDWLVFLREAGLGGLLADDMGLGKTLQALCALRPPALVISPTSVLHNWLAEARRFRPALSVSVYHGPERALDPAADVTLTTYAILRLDAERLACRRWGTVVLDEAQQIKNPESQVAAAAFRLEADFRIALSGTPVENRLDELWSQFHFTNRGLLGGRQHFAEAYAGPIAAGDREAGRRLYARIRPFLLRRLKREVAPELPPRTEVVLRCELSPAEREVYDTVRAATLSEVVERLAAGGGVLAALEALLRLRQAACHASLVPGRTIERSAKQQLLLESLETVVAEGHKALVYSQWTGLLDLIEPGLAAAGLSFVRLDGSTRDRAAVVRRFQEEAELPLMLVSLKAGGTGLNLTAADDVFLLDPWWNPAVEDQAADRAHRIGRERAVMIYRLVAIDTVEERILELQERKRELAGLVLEGSGAASRLTRDDLLALLA